MFHVFLLPLHQQIKNNMYIERIKENNNVTHFHLHDDIKLKIPSEYITAARINREYRVPRYLEEIYGIDKRYFYFCNFMTISEARNKGYGRTLIENVKKHYKRYYKHTVIYLCVDAFGCGKMLNNEQLINFYKSEGFNVIEHEGRYPYENYTVMAIEL